MNISQNTHILTEPGHCLVRKIQSGPGCSGVAGLGECRCADITAQSALQSACRACFEVNHQKWIGTWGVGVSGPIFGARHMVRISDLQIVSLAVGRYRREADMLRDGRVGRTYLLM